MSARAEPAPEHVAQEEHEAQEAHEPATCAAELPPLLAETGTVPVEGCEVRWYAGGTGGPTLMLVHGGGGHAAWWEPVLPALIARQRVIALDLSGHGDSGRRPSGYTTPTWAQEVASVLETVAHDRAAVVGHSLGGRIGTMAAGRYPELVSALVTLDAVVPPQPGEPIPRVRPAKFYASEEQILAAFRLMPPQPPAAPAIMARLARRSIARLPDGRFTWKFDPTVFAALDEHIVNGDIPKIRCPVTLVRGGLSDVTQPAIAAEYRALLGRELQTFTLAASHHHVPLDVPEELERLLATLPGTRPRAGATGDRATK
jgi:pimeloyl-ACP methyl ester carboxylesterase